MENLQTIGREEQISSPAAESTGRPRDAKKRAILFVALTFVIAWALVMIPAGLGLLTDQYVVTVIFSLAMFIPALMNLLTRLITKEGFTNLWCRVERKPGRWKTILFAAYAPIFLILLGGLVYFLIFPNHFDWELTVFESLMGETTMTLGVILAVQILQIFLLGPFINLIPCLGEELGWRGYLLPKLLELGSERKAILLSGLVWGIWHAPMIALGHNYGTGYWGYPVTGILLMTAFCIFFGMLASYVTIKTHSCLPAAIAHSSLNAGGGLFIYLDKAPNLLLGPAPMGIVAMIPTILLGLYLLGRVEKA